MHQRFVVIAGPGGSGKTKLMRRMCAEDPSLIPLERDCFREAMECHPQLDEWHLSQIVGDAAWRILVGGGSVICVGWNMEPSDEAMWQHIQSETGVEIEWYDTRRPEVQALIPPLAA